MQYPVDANRICIFSIESNIREASQGKGTYLGDIRFDGEAGRTEMRVLAEEDFRVLQSIGKA